MVVTRVKNGTTYEFEFKWEVIDKYEQADPNYSVFREIDSMRTNPRFATLYRLAALIGWNYKEFALKGFSVNELSEILNDCLVEVGFRWDAAEPDSSSEENGTGPQI